MSYPDLGPHMAPVVVPWTEDYEIDEDAMRKHMRYLASVRGMTGIVMNIHAGEAYSLSVPERLKTLGLAVSELKGETNIACGVTPQPDHNRAAVELAKAVEAAGADAIVLMAPHWFAFGVNQVPQIAIDYVEEVAAAIDLPIIVYQLGSWTGAHYTIDALKKVCEVDSVVGVKMVTMDTQEFEDTLVELKAMKKENFRVYTGNDNVMLYNYIAGADGTLVGLHNSYAEVLIDMYDAVAEGNLANAFELHYQQFEITRLLFADPPLKYRSRYKAAAMLQGKLPNARCRPPLPEITGAELAAIDAALERANMKQSYAGAV